MATGAVLDVVVVAEPSPDDPLPVPFVPDDPVDDTAVPEPPSGPAEDVPFFFAAAVLDDEDEPPFASLRASLR